MGGNRSEAGTPSRLPPALDWPAATLRGQPGGHVRLLQGRPSLAFRGAAACIGDVANIS